MAASSQSISEQDTMMRPEQGAGYERVLPGDHHQVLGTFDLQEVQLEFQQQEEEVILEQDVGCSGKLKQVLKLYRKSRNRCSAARAADEGWWSGFMRKLVQCQGNKVQPKEDLSPSVVLGADKQEQFTFQAQPETVINLGRAEEERTEFFTQIGKDSIWMERFKSLSFSKIRGVQEQESNSEEKVATLWQRRMLSPIPVLSISR